MTAMNISFSFFFLRCIFLFYQNLESSKEHGVTITLGSEPKELVIRDKAFSMTGDPAPWAESDPTSS